jgi:uncharacterized protein YprB with RNaseH-like and TPR domain
MTDIKDLKCVHRHSIETHPSCFAKGLIKYDFESDKEWEKITGQPWYTFPEYRVGYLDIETDNLKADFGTMLSWAIKEKEGNTTVGVITKKELFSEVEVDKRLVKDLIDVMREYRIIVTYFGTRFDLAFARAKALHYGLNFPEYGEIYHHDLFYTVKSKICISRKSLESVCDYLGISGKTPIEREAWRRAKYGNEEALREVVEHNVGDVEILELLHNKLEPFRKWTRSSV